MNPWKFLGVKKLHVYLCSKFDIYRKWHWHPHHQKIHWVAFGINVAVLLFITLLSFIPLFSQNTKAEATAITVSPAGYTNADEFTFTLTGDPIAGATKYQYRTEEDDPVTGWVDFSPVLSTTVTIPNANHPNGKYTEGENFFYFRALDSGDNVIESLQKTFFYNITPPSPPGNPLVSPPSNTLNSFTLSWDAPSAFGDPNKIKYYYSINALPNQYNTTETSSLSTGPGAFATIKGTNIFYVIAKDEAGNIDYESCTNPVSPSCSWTTFSANTSAPPIPTGLQINDISSKDTGQYRLVVSWVAPTFSDPENFKGYDVYSSTSEGGPFTKIGTTAETSYVQTGLTKDAHRYYYVKATDKTGNESAQSTVVDEFATGKYTIPPNITKNSIVSAGSKSASINWGTSREASSYVEYGKTNALGQSTGNGPTRYVTDHMVALTNLESATTYYYKAVFTDSDGNTGQTSIATFTTLATPTISNIKIEDIGTSSLTVSFETSVPSHGEVDFGITPNYDNKVEEENVLVTKHSVKISGLTDGSKYYIGIKQTDAEGNIFTPNTYETSTLPKPKIEDIKVQGKKNVDNPTIQVEYSTNIETTTDIKYTAESGETKEYSTMSYTKDHKAELTSLTPLKLYTLEITGIDRFGNIAETKTAKVTTLSDTMPPKIVNITEKKKTIGEGADAVAVLTIKLTTNEPSKIIIEASQGIDTKNFNIVSTEDPLNTEHTVEIKLGKPGVPYTYHIRMADYSGNEGETPTKTFIASAANQGVLGFITGAFTRSFGWLGKFIKL